MPKRADQNQIEIVAVLREAGAIVTDTHEIAKGFPDLFCWFRGKSFLFEVKSPGGKLTKSEQKWMEKNPGASHIVYSPEDALRIIGAI